MKAQNEFTMERMNSNFNWCNQNQTKAKPYCNWSSRKKQDFRKISVRVIFSQKTKGKYMKKTTKKKKPNAQKFIKKFLKRKATQPKQVSIASFIVL